MSGPLFGVAPAFPGFPCLRLQLRGLSLWSSTFGLTSLDFLLSRPLRGLLHLLQILPGQHGLTTFVCGLTRCMDSEADLSSAIAEVQLALERLRIASIRASPPRATASAPIPCLSVIALSTALICVCGSLPAHCHLKPGPDEPGDTVGRAGHRLIVNRRGVL